MPNLNAPASNDASDFVVDATLDFEAGLSAMWAREVAKHPRKQAKAAAAEAKNAPERDAA